MKVVPLCQAELAQTVGAHTVPHNLGFKDHLCLYVSVQVDTSRRLCCHADHQWFSRCHSRGESEESITCRQQSTQARNPPCYWNPGQRLPEVKKQGYYWCSPPPIFFLKVIPLLFSIMGLPHQSEWPDCVSLPWTSFKAVAKQPFEKFIPDLEPTAKDLLEVSRVKY